MITLGAREEPNESGKERGQRKKKKEGDTKCVTNTNKWKF